MVLFELLVMAVILAIIFSILGLTCVAKALGALVWLILFVLLALTLVALFL